MQNLTALLFSVRGRIGRGTFCISWLVAMAFLFAPIILLAAAGFLDTATEKQSDAEKMIIVIVVLLAFILSAWAQIAVCVKRFHDLGQPGTAAVLVFIPIVGLLAILGLMLWPGTKERNEFGEVPQQLFDIGRAVPADTRESQAS